VFEGSTGFGTPGEGEERVVGRQIKYFEFPAAGGLNRELPTRVIPGF
jgi:hypothetical protein